MTARTSGARRSHADEAGVRYRITELTSLIARRRVSCSKWANGKHSIAKSFSHESGNIWFESMDHT